MDDQDRTSAVTPALTAAEFDALSPDARRQCAAEVHVLARVEPHHKQTLVEALQAQHEVTRLPLQLVVLGL
jgi:magnesium-transporting ATPase (P-type)